MTFGGMSCFHVWQAVLQNHGPTGCTLRGAELLPGDLQKSCEMAEPHATTTPKQHPAACSWQKIT